MAKARSVKECRTAAEFDQAICRSGVRFVERQNGTSHRVYKFPEAGVSVPIPQHGGEIPTGTRRSIAKMLALVGLSVLFPFILCNLSALVGAVPGISM